MCRLGGWADAGAEERLAGHGDNAALSLLASLSALGDEVID